MESIYHNQFYIESLEYQIKQCCRKSTDSEHILGAVLEN